MLKVNTFDVAKPTQMNQNTILNWDNTDYKEIYTRQLRDNPLYWNQDLDCWVTYAYEFCKTILLNADAHVPAPVGENDSLLNDKAKLMIRNLSRISNDQQHADSRQAALIIYQSMKPVSISGLLENLLSDIENIKEFDWVATVCKKLPALVILKELGFSDDECAFVVDNISFLVKIMSPNKTDSDITAINSVIDEFYVISEKYIKSYKFSADHLAGINKEKAIELFVCNLLGLFIQCYDAGRGILTNTLLSFVHNHNSKLSANESYFKRMVIETLRFDPPVHNTRRVPVKDIWIGGEQIKAGQSILVATAAANLDASVFQEPGIYDPERNNNDQHLTFGIGAHNCLAKHLTINMASETCSFLTDNYRQIKILPQELKYEPQLNVRLIKELIINL
ncbi:MAG TPA: cytochrome P450 [Mucilaginibacter sp.]|jgi:hypothetical protein